MTKDIPQMKTPELDGDGYPTQETLEAVKNWKISSNKDINELLGFVRKVWQYGFSLEVFGEGTKRHIQLSTSGWSGNEDLIEALQSNRMFWLLCWFESRRGGHYKFLTHPVKES